MKVGKGIANPVTARFRLVLFAALLPMTFASCSVPVPPPTELMTPLEQILVSEAAEKCAKSLHVAMPAGSKVAIESYGLTPGHTYMGGVVAGWLGRKGFFIAEEAQEAAYLIRVVVQTLGTEKSERTFGTEGVESALLPVGLPPITLFKRAANKGHARFYMDIYEARTGQLIHSTPWFEGTSYLNKYTVFFFITINSTDLSSPP